MKKTKRSERSAVVFDAPVIYRGIKIKPLTGKRSEIGKIIRQDLEKLSARWVTNKNLSGHGKTLTRTDMRASEKSRGKSR